MENKIIKLQEMQFLISCRKKRVKCIRPSWCHTGRSEGLWNIFPVTKVDGFVICTAKVFWLLVVGFITEN